MRYLLNSFLGFNEFMEDKIVGLDFINLKVVFWNLRKKGFLKCLFNIKRVVEVFWLVSGSFVLLLDIWIIKNKIMLEIWDLIYVFCKNVF